MFPSFTSLSQRESKRQELLRQAEKELAIERQLDQRYAEAMWAADNESGLLVYPKPTNGTDTQTDLTIPPSATTGVQAGVPAATAMSVDSVADPGVFSEADRMRVDAALSGAPAVAAPLSPLSTASDQKIAYDRIKNLFAKFPEVQTWGFNPIFNTLSKKRRGTYSLGKDMELFLTRDRRFVGEDNQKRLSTEIDWVSTLGHIEEQMQAKGLLPKTVNTDAALSGMVPVPGNAPPPAVVPPVVDEKKREALEKLDAIATRRSKVKTMNTLKSDLPNWGPDQNDLKASGDGRVGTQAELLRLSRSKPKKVQMMETAGNTQSRLRDIYKDNPWLIKYSLPIQVETADLEYTTLPSNVWFDNNLNIVDSKTGNDVSAKYLKDTRILWLDNFEATIYFLYTVVDYYRAFPEKIDKDHFRSNLRDAKSTLEDLGFQVRDDAPMRREDLEMKPPAVGRGLTGAGYINKELKDKDGNLIKYHSNKGYNLAQLEGTGNASALAYKRIGTKFLHLPKLNDHLLKVVYPNRSAVGAQKRISAELAQLIKTLVFDGTIDNQLYESLPLADKRVFHELLRITHTQHALRDPVKDPRDVLKQEYIKLKGELMLGNDNPAMIRELKQVLVDMYSAKLISDDEFKQVLVALV
jgi:hypothetical protein